MSSLRGWLAHPLMRGVDPDDPSTPALRRRVIGDKPFLKALYREWYGMLMQGLPEGEGRVLELGSGGGFLREHLTEALTSDVFASDGLDLVLDARSLPFGQGALRAIVMTDVFHHIPDVSRFLRDAGRCVRPEGTILMVEPWHTPWSRWVYRHLHHEPFMPDVPEWVLPAMGPMTGANGALPWIVFARDRARFELEFPEWRIERIRLLMPFRYLLSGGVSMRSLMPGCSFGAWRAIEGALTPLFPLLAMFAQITLRRL